jgi:hypothetical protein
VSGGNILPYHLLHLKGPQLFYQPRPDDENDEKSGQNRIDGPKSDITENIEEGKKLVKRIKEMI